MVERVGDDRVFLAEDGFEEPAVGVETAGVEDGVLGLEETAEPSLQRLVEVLGAADETDRSHSKTGSLQRLARRLDHPGVVGQAEIVVGAEVEDFAPPLDANDGVLRREEDALALVKARLAQLSRPGGQVGQECGVHGPLSTRLPAKRPRDSRDRTVGRPTAQTVVANRDLRLPQPPGGHSDELQQGGGR
jgi:hypothetical protein